MIDDVRKCKRFDVEFDVDWMIESQGVSGKGKLLDVTMGGACFRITQSFTAPSALTFTMQVAELPAFPKRGRLRWFRRLPGRHPMFLCGVVFEDGDLSEWSRWLAQSNS